MKIVNILGGLGNQMFEYALYLALKDANPEEDIKLCTRSYGGYGLHNGLEINQIFNVAVNEASLLELCKVAYPFINYTTWRFMFHFLPKRKSMTYGTTQIPYNAFEITRKDSCYYDGSWQNELFFKQIRNKILNDFSFPNFNDERNISLAEKLYNTNSVSVHIRRGDYLKEPVWCVCTPSYYEKAMLEIQKRDMINLFCVFSDDIQWCKENLKGIAGDTDIEYVDWNHGSESFRDMQLMTYCKHNIIANSTFSWWGAWLGQRDGKIVMTPHIWAKKTIVNDPICDNWIRIQTE